MQRISHWIGEHLPINRSKRGTAASHYFIAESAASGFLKGCAKGDNGSRSKSMTTTIKNNKAQQKQLIKRISLTKSKQTAIGSKIEASLSKYGDESISNKNIDLSQIRRSSYNKPLYDNCAIVNFPRKAQHSTIRTNPWINRKELGSDATISTRFGRSKNLELYDQTKLEDSICSSGYGTGAQTTPDNSPECSVHSPDWQASAISSNNTSFQSFSSVLLSNNNDSFQRTNLNPVESKKLTLETAQRDHIYFELEPSNKLSLLLDHNQSTSYSDLYSESDDEYNFPVSKNVPAKFPIEESNDPIYAIPYINEVQHYTHNNNKYCSIGNVIQKCHSPFKLKNSSKFVAENHNRDRIIPSVHSFELKTASSNSSTKIQTKNNRRRHIIYTTPSTNGESSSSDGEFSSTSCDSWLPVQRTKQHRQRNNLKHDKLISENSRINDHQRISKYQPKNNDILADLDEQIAELQMQSNAVRQLVEQAKRRRKETRSKCMEHLDEIQKRYLFTAHKFELYL